jgi:sirohydrochlorin cobaltochelatase
LARKRYIVWVCTMDGAGRCGSKGGKDVLTRFRSEVAARRLDNVMVTPNGCTDRHDHGPVVLVDPDGTWYCGVGPEDVDEIVELHLCNDAVDDGPLCQ